MPKTKKSVQKVSASKSSNSVFNQFSTLPLIGKIAVVVVLVAGLTFAGSYGISKYRSSEYQAFANNALPDKWAVLKSGYGYTWYTCQQRVDGKLYARGIVVKPTKATAQSITVHTYSNSSMDKQTGFATNHAITVGYQYFGDEISAPAATLPEGGWAKVTIAGEAFPVAQGFMPPCDSATQNWLSTPKITPAQTR